MHHKLTALAAGIAARRFGKTAAGKQCYLWTGASLTEQPANAAGYVRRIGPVSMGPARRRSREALEFTGRAEHLQMFTLSAADWRAVWGDAEISRGQTWFAAGPALVNNAAVPDAAACFVYHTADEWRMDAGVLEIDVVRMKPLSSL